MLRRLAHALALLPSLALPVAAEVALEGVFVAERACPALVSIRKGTNPDDAALRPGERYRLIAQNRRDATHYRVELPKAEGERRRWVETGCGRRESADAAAPTAPPEPGATDTVLAVSWLPAFCEGAGGRPECRRLESGARMAAADAFALHGLWPQPRSAAYCGDAAGLERRRWSDLPFPGVDRETAAALVSGMPGVESHLHRHQWAKHGSCYGAAGGADEYFDDALWLLDQLNASGLRDLVAGSVGRRLDPPEIRAAADAAFGRGAGERVEVVCGDGMIVELRLALRGTIVAGETALGDLLRAARPVRPGCGGRVDAAGG